MSVGMSKAVDRPVWPEASKNLKRWLVSSGVPKPANMRIVHGLPRYIVACGPRVNGNGIAERLLSSRAGEIAELACSGRPDSWARASTVAASFTTTALHRGCYGAPPR
jgi:hypothetical protein